MPKVASSAWKTAITSLQEVQPPFIPEGAHAMTVVVEFPPGDPGSPPHRHSGSLGDSGEFERDQRTHAVAQRGDGLPAIDI